jgi:hypothetical protein
MGAARLNLATMRPCGAQGEITMKLYTVLTAVAVSALVSTGAFAGGTGGGSHYTQIGGAAGVYSTGAAGAQGSVDVHPGYGGNSSVGNVSTTGTTSGLGVGAQGGLGAGGGTIAGGGNGAIGVTNVSTATNTVTTQNAYGDIQSNTAATSASGGGFGIGGNTLSAGGGNH